LGDLIKEIALDRAKWKKGIHGNPKILG